MVKKREKKAEVVDVTVTCDRNIRKRNTRSLTNTKGWRKTRKGCGEVPVVIGALGAMTPK